LVHDEHHRVEHPCTLVLTSGMPTSTRHASASREPRPTPRGAKATGAVTALLEVSPSAATVGPSATRPTPCKPASEKRGISRASADLRAGPSARRRGLFLGVVWLGALACVLGLIGLRTSGDRDRGGLADDHAVLGRDFRGHSEARGNLMLYGDLDALVAAVDAARDGLLGRDGAGEGAEVRVGGQRRVGALRERQFEARDGLVGDLVEGRARDALL